MWVQTSEDLTLLRDIYSHETDLLLENPTETGLKRDCVPNNLSYQVAHNVAEDIMHDNLEGVGPYEGKLVLNSLTEQKHPTQNNHGFCDKSNNPYLIISKTHPETRPSL